MFRNADEVKAELDDSLKSMEALTEMEGASEEDFKAATQKHDSLEAELDKIVKFEEAKAAVVARMAESNKAAVQPAAVPATPEKEVVNVIPAKVKAQRTKHFASAEDAFTAGMYLAHLGGDRRAGERRPRLKWVQL